MRKHSGFTLIELVIVLAIAAILTAMAGPSFRSIIQNNRATTQANELLSALNLARSEAIKRGVPVIVCARDGTSSACSGSTAWSPGWLVFADANGNGTLENDPNGNGQCDPGEDCLIRAREALDANSTLSADNARVQFLASGRAAAATNLALVPSDCTGDQARAIGTGLSGRSSVDVATCP